MPDLGRIAAAIERIVPWNGKRTPCGHHLAAAISSWPSTTRWRRSPCSKPHFVTRPTTRSSQASKTPQTILASASPTSASLAESTGVSGRRHSEHRAEIAPFGIHTTIVNPGFFRTELLTAHSTSYAAPSIADYDERRGPLVAYWKSQNGQQVGDPGKLARALLTIAEQQPPPRRFIAGADAIAGAEQKLLDLKAQIESNRTLSTSLAFD